MYVSSRYAWNSLLNIQQFTGKTLTYYYRPLSTRKGHYRPHNKDDGRECFQFIHHVGGYPSLWCQVPLQRLVPGPFWGVPLVLSLVLSKVLPKRRGGVPWPGQGVPQPGQGISPSQDRGHPYARTGVTTGHDRGTPLDRRASDVTHG